MTEYSENFTCGRGTPEEQALRAKKKVGMSLGTSRTATPDELQLDEQHYNPTAFCPHHGQGTAARIRGRWGMNCCGAEPIQEG